MEGKSNVVFWTEKLNTWDALNAHEGDVVVMIQQSGVWIRGVFSQKTAKNILDVVLKGATEIVENEKGALLIDAKNITNFDMRLVGKNETMREGYSGPFLLPKP